MEVKEPLRNLLIRFDLTGVIPSGAFVNSATLSLCLHDVLDYYPGDVVLVAAYQIRAGRAWVETEATWNKFTVTSPWSTPGCENALLDRYPNPDGWEYFYDSSPVNVYHDWDVTPSVQDWVAGAANDGWVLRGDYQEMTGDVEREGVSFYLKEYSDAAHRPRLTIEYEPGLAAEPTSWSRIKGLYR